MSSSSIVQLIINHQAQVNSSFETLLSSARSILGVVGDSNTNISGPPQQMDPEHETQRSAGATQTAAAAAAAAAACAGAGGSSSIGNTSNVTTNQPSAGTTEMIAAEADAGGDSVSANTNNGATNQPSTGKPPAVAGAGASVGINVNIENGTTNQPSTPCVDDSSNNVTMEILRTTNQPPSVSPETSGTSGTKMSQSNDDSTISDDGRYNQSDNRKRCNAPPSDSSNITGEFICRFFNGSDEFHPPPTVDSSSSNKRTKIKQEQEV